MSLQQSFCSGHVLGQLLRGHQASDAVDPGHQVPDKSPVVRALLGACTPPGGPRGSPEVGQEALQVVGVGQLVLALVGPAHQAAPGGVQLAALVLDVLQRLRVGLDQALGRLPQRVDLGTGEAA